jgi:hypothetical protein
MVRLKTGSTPVATRSKTGEAFPVAISWIEGTDFEGVVLIAWI